MKAATGVLLPLILALGLNAQPTEQTDFFYVDGKKVELKRLSEYMAIKLSRKNVARSKGFLSKALSVLKEVLLLPATAGAESLRSASRRPLVLVGEVPSGQSPQSIVETLGEEYVEDVRPVYSLGTTRLVLSDEIIVQFKPEVRKSDMKMLLDNVGEARRIKKMPGKFIVTVSSNRSALDTANELSLNPRIRYAEPNFSVIFPARPRIVPAEVPPVDRLGQVQPGDPSDPYFGMQWALQNRGDRGKAGADIRAKGGWNVTRGSKEVIIAIIDEGVDTKHPDLAGKIYHPYDAIDGDKDQEPNPWDGHGTACAGIAAAVTGNARGIAGVGWNVKIMPVRIARSERRGGPWITDCYTIGKGIYEAVKKGADVLSNSWGGGCYSNHVNDAIEYALTKGRNGKGAILVFAAGNESSSVNWPANLSASKPIIAVSATNEWDEFKSPGSRDGENWWGSNFGPEVTVAAPGVHILTTDIRGSGGYDTRSDYVWGFNGTSSSTPHVAGLAALLVSKHPDWTVDQVRDQIIKTADDLGPGGFDNQYGYGRINVCRALGGNC